MNNQMSLCAVVTGDTLEKFLLNLDQIQQLSDIVELRIDYIKNLELKDLVKIKQRTYKKNIFTLRHLEDGGNFCGSADLFKTIIKQAVNLHFDHVDISVSKLKFFTKMEESVSTVFIGSYHNFKGTPDYKILKRIVKDIFKYSVISVAKVATFVHNLNDNINLMKLLINWKGNRKLLVVGMGYQGKIMRVVAPFFGSYLTFASTKYSKTAAGQISFEKLKNMYMEICNDW